MNTKSLFVLLWAALLSAPCYSQLDSVVINTNFTVELDPNNPGDSIEFLNVNIWFNDSTDVGSIELTVYDTSGVEIEGYLFEDSTNFEIYYSADTSGFFNFPVRELAILQNYLLKVTVTDKQGYYLPEEELTVAGQSN